MTEINFTFPFLTNEVSFFNGEFIRAGEQKFFIKEECFCEADENANYFVFGKINTRLIENIRMDWQDTLKESLKFVSKTGDLLLFNTPEIIMDKKDWEGLSGSPVFNEDGECVGVLCDVLENSRSIWVMPISKVKMLIDIIVLQENLGLNNEHNGDSKK